MSANETDSDDNVVGTNTGRAAWSILHSSCDLQEIEFECNFNARTIVILFSIEAVSPLAPAERFHNTLAPTWNGSRPARRPA